jgi:hypothetical protein
LTAHQALNLYLGTRIAVGAPADFCLMKAPLRDVLHILSADLVQVTCRGGALNLQSQTGPTLRQGSTSFDNNMEEHV